MALIEQLRSEADQGPVDPRLEDLERMRSELLAAMDAVEPGDLPRVCRELRAVDADLAGISPARSPEQVMVDDLKARRAARRPAS